MHSQDLVNCIVEINISKYLQLFTKAGFSQIQSQDTWITEITDHNLYDEWACMQLSTIAM